MWCERNGCPFIKGPGDADSCEHLDRSGKCNAPDEWEMECAIISPTLYVDTIHGTTTALRVFLEDAEAGEKYEVQKKVMTKSEYESLPEFEGP